jgi:hypothetical protein
MFFVLFFFCDVIHRQTRLKQTLPSRPYRVYPSLAFNSGDFKTLGTLLAARMRVFESPGMADPRISRPTSPPIRFLHYSITKRLPSSVVYLTTLYQIQMLCTMDLKALV